MRDEFDERKTLLCVNGTFRREITQSRAELGVINNVIVGIVRDPSVRDARSAEYLFGVFVISRHFLLKPCELIDQMCVSKQWYST